MQLPKASSCCLRRLINDCGSFVGVILYSKIWLGAVDEVALRREIAYKEGLFAGTTVS